MTRYTMEFDEYSGYDCMSAGFTIMDNVRHKAILVIDVADFTGLKEDDRLRHPEAERVANIILAALNHDHLKGSPK